MTSRGQQKRRKSLTQILTGPDSRQSLDILLALDRMLVEVSMSLYEVPHSDRPTMREHNRRLHKTVRQHMPRLLKTARARS
jgi:hypothetical protein